MFMDYNVSTLKGVGPKRVEQFERLDVHTVYDLLHFYPRTYQDWSSPVAIFGAELSEEKVCVRATVRSAPSRFRARSGITVFECRVFDATGPMKVLIFNNKYAAAKLEPGKEFLFYGKVTLEGNMREMLSPDIEDVGEKCRIRPVYRTTKNMSSKYIEGCMEKALAQYGSFAEESLPYDLRKQYGLLSLKEALQEIHFPSSMERMMQARRRFIFEELLDLQLGMCMLREDNKAGSDVILRDDCSEEFYGFLPFEPTGAQKRAVEACVQDMKSGFLMNRLVQGDVGSGKTMVAAALVYVTAKNGYQSAMMAPTEILAEQHFATMQNFFRDTGVTVELLTGSTTAAEKKRIKAALRNGDIDFIVGTHALLTEDVWFDELGLVITDEQHRFGVRQRGALAEKGEGAHVMVMSATPIPRTLALAIYGDLDVSVIDELPKGRQPIETYRIDSSIRERAYGYIKKFLDEGRQGYIVCPLVEEGETEELVPGGRHPASRRHRRHRSRCRCAERGHHAHRERGTVRPFSAASAAGAGRPGFPPVHVHPALGQQEPEDEGAPRCHVQDHRRLRDLPGRPRPQRPRRLLRPAAARPAGDRHPRRDRGRCPRPHGRGPAADASGTRTAESPGGPPVRRKPQHLLSHTNAKRPRRVSLRGLSCCVSFCVSALISFAAVPRSPRPV